MKVVDLPQGRLGNAIFRYLASTLFCIVYGAERSIKVHEANYSVSDELFIQFMNAKLAGIDFIIERNTNYIFNGYYQHDLIYQTFKNEIILHIVNNPNDKLITVGIHEPYQREVFFSTDLIYTNKKIPKYDVVVHLRLEDFITNNSAIHPKSIKDVLDKIGKTGYCFVVNELKTEVERKYVEYFRKYYDVVIESNDIITDYHIMKNANILVCQCSTISWAAALMSHTITRVYLPNYKNQRVHEGRYWETLSSPVENTIGYDYEICSQSSLEEFLNSQDLVNVT